MTSRDPELDALLGAYALDALDDTERARVDEYLARQPAARDEVDELRESAAALALTPVEDQRPPAALWTKIAADLGDARGAEPARHSSTRWLVPIAAAAAIAAALLPVQVFSLQRDLDAARVDNAALEARFEAATRSAGARQVALTPGDGAEVARLVLLPDGTGYLVNDALAPLEPDQTYQLWVLMGDESDPSADPTVISAGVLGAEPGAATFKTVGPVVGFALTVERAGGVTSSVETPVATGTVA
jgi:hypothetical protein